MTHPPAQPMASLPSHASSSPHPPPQTPGHAAFLFVYFYRLPRPGQGPPPTANANCCVELCLWEGSANIKPFKIFEGRRRSYYGHPQAVTGLAKSHQVVPGGVSGFWAQQSVVLCSRLKIRSAPPPPPPHLPPAFPLMGTVWACALALGGGPPPRKWMICRRLAVNWCSTVGSARTNRH